MFFIYNYTIIAFRSIIKFAVFCIFCNIFIEMIYFLVNMQTLSKWVVAMKLVTYIVGNLLPQRFIGNMSIISNSLHTLYIMQKAISFLFAIIEIFTEHFNEFLTINPISCMPTIYWICKIIFMFYWTSFIFICKIHIISWKIITCKYATDS